MQVADARQVSQGLQESAAGAASQSSACLQQASEAGNNFVAMADGLMEAACALPASINSLSDFCQEGSRALDDTLAVLQEASKIVEASPCALLADVRRNCAYMYSIMHESCRAAPRII